MKQKMSAVDVRALVLLLQKKLIGLRVANIYDVSGRIYLLKLSRANRKEHLLIESGARIHTSKFIKNQKDVPSGFSMKLRKHLRTKKLESITQLGIDRVIDLTFGKGEATYHILVELYAQGNVILTDSEYTILSLLRSHKFEENARCAVKEKYPFSHAANLTIDSITLDKNVITSWIEAPQQDEEQKQQATEESKGASDKKDQSQNKSKKGQGGKQQNNQKQQTKKKQEKEKQMNLKSLLSKMVPYASASYAEHFLRKVGADPNAKAEVQLIDQVTEAAKLMVSFVRDMENLEQIKGYVVYKPDEPKNSKDTKLEAEEEIKLTEEEQLEKEKKERAAEEAKTEEQKVLEKYSNKILKEFLPSLLLEQHQNDEHFEYQDFDEAVDEYFSQATKHKEKVKVDDKEQAIFSRVNRIKEDQEKRISGLQREQDLTEFKALLLQKYSFEVQAIIDILSIMVNSGISWNDISRMIKDERKVNNPLANLIFKLNLERNQVSLILDAFNEEDDEQFIEIDDHYMSNFDQVMKVEIDLSISAQLNIKKYFEIKKKSHQKEIKTKDAADVAIKQAEVAAERDMEKFKQQQFKANVNRKIFWFEKYNWFITSENYLCIGGQNAQQNEALVKRYMNKDDLFFHSEQHGAAVMILKNPQGGPVPPITLNEAATFGMCHSPAWDNKVLSQIYWVQANQVSKTPPTGMFIGTGSFIIRGKRNFLSPQRLELGFTCMFCLNEESVAGHLGERKPKISKEELGNAQDDTKLVKEDFTKEPETEADLGEYNIVQVGDDGNTQAKPKNFNKQKEQQRKMALAKQQSKKSDQQEDDQINENASQYTYQKFQKNGKQQQGKGNNQKNGKKEDYSQVQNTGAVTRGKHNKIKKMKEKYADQDEEERQLRMQMLGTKQVKGFDIELHRQHKQGVIKTEAEKQTEMELEQDQQEMGNVDVQDLQKEVEEAIQIDTMEKKDQASKSQEQEIEDQKQDEDQDSDEEQIKTDEQPSLKQSQSQIEDKEIQKIMKDEDITLVPENIDVGEIDKLTGNPTSKDGLLFALPMLAPYTTIMTNKYKVKVQPGTMKRGRAAKDIRSLFIGQAGKNFPYETNLMKCVPDNDMTMSLINNCRVLAPGLTKMQQQNKQDKKKKNKS